MVDVVIRAEGLSKQYRIGAKLDGYKTLRATLTDGFVAPFRRTIKLLQGRASSAAEMHEKIWALKDVSFEIKKGEVVGVVGGNGAGKTTLLKVLSRITEPTEGQAEIHGRVGSLLEVGTGFHPELTGRENIYLNGAILGMKKAEIERKFDEMVAFAEIEKFLDTPVKHYSSGMYVRLAFAVAAHLEPDILLIDEVLAVGDVAFQKKCLGKMGDVAKEGRTIVFVSHNMGAVNQLCPSTIWLESGTIRGFARSHRIIQEYLANTFHNATRRLFDAKPNSKGQITQVRLLNKEGAECSEFACGEEPTVEIAFVINRKVTGCHLACIISTSDGFHLFSTADTDMNSALLGERLPGQYLAQVRLPTRHLNTGIYHLAVGLGIPGGASFDRQDALNFTLHDVGDFGTLKERSRRAGLLLMQVPWKYL